MLDDGIRKIKSPSAFNESEARFTSTSVSAEGYI